MAKISTSKPTPISSNFTHENLLFWMKYGMSKEEYLRQPKIKNNDR